MPFSPELIQRVATHHGIRGPVSLMPASGMVNEAWMLDERFVLRICIVDDADDEPSREAWIVPIVRAAGVRSPEVIVIDTSRQMIDRQYTIYERAEGELLGNVESDPNLFTESYRELGREIALLNKIAIPVSDISRLRPGSMFDAAEQLKKSTDAGKLNNSEIAHVEEIMGLLDPIQGAANRKTFLHQDIHPWNMFINLETLELTAIIDWGDSAYGDPAAEFASMPLCAVSDTFAGYEEAGGEVDTGMKARSLSLGLALSLWELRDLDPQRFDRRWWRLPPGGFEETRRVIEALL